ncbi:MAG: DUF481 domain-containing protein [bacterium]|nr:DUF481 domain-containing protein [bacterium]
MEKFFLLSFILIWLPATTAGSHEVFLRNGDKVTGIIRKITQTEVVIETDYAGTITIDKSRVRSYFPDAFEEKIAGGEKDFKPAAKWEAKAEAGYTFSTGNSEIQSVNAKAALKRKAERTILEINGMAVYGKEDGEVTINYSEGTAKLSYFINDRVYAYALGNILRDRIALIDLRASIGGGLGYYIIKTDSLTFQAECGAEAEYTEKEHEKTLTDPVIRTAGIVNYRLNDRVSFESTVQHFANLRDHSLYHDEGTASIIIKLFEKLNAKFTIQANYENTPAGDKKRTDIMGFGSLEYEIF